MFEPDFILDFYVFFVLFCVRLVRFIFCFVFVSEMGFVKMMCLKHLKFVLILSVLTNLNFFDFVNGEFENSWTMYYEQPCCNGGGHHLRHHRG